MTKFKKDELPKIISYQTIYTHPGISITAEALQKVQNYVLEQKEPWFSYFKAMSNSKYANREFQADNLLANSPDIPREVGLNSRRVLDLLIQDSYRAYTQILMYMFTGDHLYYDNSLRLIRLWQQLDPIKTKYFPDAHIHVGWALYYTVSTAELLRTVMPPSNLANDRTWQQEDTRRLCEHFLKPAVTHFYQESDRYMNQLGYQNVGRAAAAIFMDDQELLAETVEWSTVNETSKRPNISGAIRFLFHQISKDDPRNPIKQDYVQLMEIGRDSCHAFDDLSVIALLGRMFSNQKVKVDPVTGTLSKKADAVTIFEFDDYAVLKGAEQFYRYTYGQTVPWTEFKKDGGPDYPAIEADGVQNIIDYGSEIAQLERGRTRLLKTFSEIYDVYHCQLQMSESELEKTAPALSRAAKELRPPVFYEGDHKVNFWEEIKDLTPEYWTNLPEVRGKQIIGAGEPVSLKGEILLAKEATVLDQDYCYFVKEDQQGYVRTISVTDPKFLKETAYDHDFPLDKTTQRGGNHFCLTNLMSYHGQVVLSVRTNGVAKLLVSSGNNGGRYQQPYTEILLPDTKGIWVDVLYDRRNTLSEELDFFALLADDEVQADFRSLQLITEISPLLSIVEEIPAKNWALIGDEIHLDWIEALKRHNMRYEFNSSSTDLLFNDEALIWLPQSEKTREIIISVCDDAGHLCAKMLHFTGVKDREMLVSMLSKNLASKEIYTIDSWQKVEKALYELYHAKKMQDIYLAAASVQQKVDRLELLNPKLDNGSLSYNSSPGFVTVRAEIADEQINVANLTDGDTETIDGNLYSKWLEFDFGDEYLVKTSRFGFICRTGFPNRTEGQRVYASNDRNNWKLLTEKATECCNHLQWLTVDEKYQQAYFRYLKVQVDFPGPDTDPAYPGISSRGEFYIDGDRIQK